MKACVEVYTMRIYIYISIYLFVYLFKYLYIYLSLFLLLSLYDSVIAEAKHPQWRPRMVTTEGEIVDDVEVAYNAAMARRLPFVFPPPLLLSLYDSVIAEAKHLRQRPHMVATEGDLLCEVEVAYNAAMRGAFLCVFLLLHCCYLSMTVSLARPNTLGGDRVRSPPKASCWPCWRLSTMQHRL